MKRIICTSQVVSAALLLLGCAVPPDRIESTRPRHVVVLPGILGTRFDIGGTQRFCRLVERELPDVSAQAWDWTVLERRFSLTRLDNLTDYQRNRRRAACLAREIEVWHRHNPDTPLYLLGLSGGGGMALFAAENLPANVELEAIVLISAAVSPQYDLTAALKRTCRGVYNYCSCKDQRILDQGTTTHGTMDRVYGPSAGYRGLDTRDARVFQLPWDPSMCALGNRGAHHDGLRPRFAKRYLLPLLVEDRSAIPPEWQSASAQIIRLGAEWFLARAHDPATVRGPLSAQRDSSRR